MIPPKVPYRDRAFEIKHTFRRPFELRRVPGYLAGMPSYVLGAELAVPGSPPAAVLLAAMWLHGMRPGPLLVIEAPNYIFEVSAMFLLASVAMLILGLSMVRIVVKILKVPTSILMPIILVLCAVGSFAIAGRVFDILIMLLFGVIDSVFNQLGVDTYLKTVLRGAIIILAVASYSIRSGREAA